MSAKRGTHVCHGILGRFGPDAAGAWGYFGCKETAGAVGEVGEGTGVVLPGLAAGHMLVPA